MAACGGGLDLTPEPFTRERADGKIPVKAELIHRQVQAVLDGMPEGEAEVARWQHIETDYNDCRLLSGKAEKAAEQVFADCMSERGYVYMYRIDAEQFHNDIEFEMEKKHDARIAAERKAEEKRIAAAQKAEEDRIAAEKKRQEEVERARRQKELNDALRTAVRNGDTEEEARLIAEGANPYFANYERGLIAAEKKRQEEAERARRQKELDDALVALLNLGINVNLAKVKRHIDNGADINTKGKQGWTPLHIAAAQGKTQIVLFLVKAGADVNAKDNDGDTPLGFAAAGGLTEIALFLVKAGADINTKHDNGLTPLHVAAVEGHTETALALNKAGANIIAKDNLGATPLHYAAALGQTETALALVNVRAYIDAKSDSGATPLHWAVVRGKTETALALVKAGANVFARTNNGETPLDVAIKDYGKNSRIARILRNAMGR